METWESIAKEIASRLGFNDYRVDVDLAEKRVSIFIYDGGNFLKENLPSVVESLNHLFQMIARKNNAETVFVDVNNYREERKTLLAELARAAAKKAVATKAEVSLPAMNSYERRLVHMELAVHPEVTTESNGNGKERFVVIRPIAK